jgi:AAA15 family ATPase/GTPase
LKKEIKLQHPGKGEYRMITSFNADNFRCFKRISLDDLRTINIVVGSNASGKTALLEAIRIASAAIPGVVLILNQSRGINFVLPPNPSREVFEAPWSTMFFNQDFENTISFSFTDSVPVKRSVKIFFDKTKAFTSIPSPGIKGDTGSSNIVPLKFERNQNGKKSEVYATVTAQGFPFLQALPELGPATGFYAHTQTTNSQEIARLFSQLSLDGKEKPIVKTIQKVFPFIQDLSVLSPAGQVDIYVSQLDSSIKIPATMVSAGVNKFLSIIIGLLTHRQSVALVDEIDNGFYFKTLPEIWSILLRLTKESEAQIFASTHSWECLKAAVPTIHEDVNAFTLIRTSKDVAGCTAEVVRGIDVVSAIEANIEVR